MPTIDELLGKAREVADAAGKKTTELLDKTKIRMEISSLEKQLAATYEGIGRLVYDAETSGEDISELKKDAYESVAQQQARIEELQNKLYDYSHAVRCKSCGAINEEDALFCKKCGEKL
ncbi:MAG: zinc ribbon domain-containing protein [Acutalibacteraceae bacterium]